LQLITLKKTHTRARAHTHTFNKTPLDERSARSKDLYMATHNTHKQQISVPGEIRTRSPSNQAAADIRPRQSGHWDRSL